MHLHKDEPWSLVIRNAIKRSQSTLGREAEIQALRDSYALLTHRERQVMALVVSGLLNKQVGGELGITEITVKAHCGKVTQKMKANSLAELVKDGGEALKPMAADAGISGLERLAHS